MHQTHQAVRADLRCILFVGLATALMLLSLDVFASEGKEFAAAVKTWEGWIKGNLGRLAAIVAVSVGSIMAAVKKDWSWFFGGLILALGINIMVGIIDASFTATV